jgi:chromosomal replication initiator protein
MRPPAYRLVAPVVDLAGFMDFGTVTLPAVVKRCPSLLTIKREVCDFYHLNLIEMVSQRRAREVARPRQVAMYLSKKLTPKSLPDIGRHFGNRDHTTVIHAVRQVEHLMSVDGEFATDVEIIRGRLVN